MPYEIKHDGPEDKPYCVYNSQTGKKMGCSPTEEESKKHMSALYANEKEVGVSRVKAFLANIVQIITAFFDSEEAKDTTPSENTFTVFKDDNGDWRWASISSTGFLDRDNEIVASKALAAATPTDQGDFGDLCFWHEQGIVLGKCDTHFTEGVCLVESGPWGKDEIADKFREYASKHPEDGAISIRFKTSMATADKGVVVGGVKISNVFNDIEIVERSYLPASRASNVFTVFEADGGANVRKEKLELLRKVIGQKAADKIAGTVDVLNEFAATPDAIVKENDVVTEPVTETVVEPVKEETVVSTDTVITETITEPIKEEIAEDKEMPTNRVDMPGAASSSINDVETPAEVVMVEEAPLQALRMWAQSLPEAKQKELAPIIIALADKLEAKDDELEAQQNKIDQQTVTPSASNDPTSTPPKQQDPTSKKEEEVLESTVKQEALEAEMKASLASIAARIDAFASDLAQLKEATERQKQEAMPRGVLQRVFSDPSSGLTKEQQETLIAKGQETGPVADMAASVLKTFGGT